MDPAALSHSSSSSVSCARIFSMADLIVLASADDGFRSNAIVNACGIIQRVSQVVTAHVDGHGFLQSTLPLQRCRASRVDTCDDDIMLC